MNHRDREDSRKRGQEKSVTAKKAVAHGVPRASELLDWHAIIDRWQRPGGYLDQIYGDDWRDELLNES